MYLLTTSHSLTKVKHLPRKMRILRNFLCATADELKLATLLDVTIL